MSWILGVLLLVGTVSCGRRFIKEIPPELLGRWTTTVRNYADRYMEFRAEEIEFGTGGATSTTGELRGLRRSEQDGEITFEIHYFGEENLEYTMPLVYSPAEGGSLYLTNMPEVIWRRADRHR